MKNVTDARDVVRAKQNDMRIRIDLIHTAYRHSLKLDCLDQFHKAVSSTQIAHDEYCRILKDHCEVKSIKASHEEFEPISFLGVAYDFCTKTCFFDGPRLEILTNDPQRGTRKVIFCCRDLSER